MSEEEEPVHPKLLKELSLSIKHLEEAASVNERREQQIKARLLAEQRAALDAMPAASGVTEQTKQAIREALGIS
jgi:uncharacterized heparinase superfamily protein